MLRELDFSDASVADLKEGFKEIFREDLWDRSQGVVKGFLEEAIASLSFSVPKEHLGVWRGKSGKRKPLAKAQRRKVRTR